jgi:hypothetical protein
MSTIDIGIAETPRPVQAPARFVPTARPFATPAPAVDEGFFYVGSVKIEAAMPPGPTAPAHDHSLVAVTT